MYQTKQWSGCSGTKPHNGEEVQVPNQTTVRMFTYQTKQRSDYSGTKPKNGQDVQIRIKSTKRLEFFNTYRNKLLELFRGINQIKHPSPWAYKQSRTQ